MDGAHLIAGKWISKGERFRAEPLSDAVRDFPDGTADNVDQACRAAENAFESYAQLGRVQRAEFLDAIADEIEARGGDLTEMGTDETGLPVGRLEGERARTTGQIRMFAELIRSKDYLDIRHDEELPDRSPQPRPDLKVLQKPVGPVAVFGASNFPLAFSAAGGDTASALAAGCPVVVKGHPAHPGTGQIVAEAIDAAVRKCGVNEGVFALVHGSKVTSGQALVQHPLIQAVGFTGSLSAGRALFDLCAARACPIPFYGELGSINPMFLLRHAAKSRGAEIANRWVQSLTMGAGQFCTNPGVCVVMAQNVDGFEKEAISSLAEIAPQTMLTEAIAGSFIQGTERVKAGRGVEELYTGNSGHRSAGPALFKTHAKTWLENTDLSHEVFGPLGIIVVVDDLVQMKEVAKSLDGQLTCTLHLEASDHDDAQTLLPILERKAGRILFNGYPTGVEVCDAMVHGGPYPASTNNGHTSVGTLAIRRWIRPVCYQNMPSELLPEDLRQ